MTVVTRCGNGIKEGTEACDGGACCGTPGTPQQCQMKRVGQICGKRIGPCNKRPRCAAGMVCDVNVLRKQGVPCINGAMTGFCNGKVCQKTKPTTTKAATTTKKTTTKATTTKKTTTK